MARQILPKKLREKILDMFREGYTELEVFDKVNYEAKDYPPRFISKAFILILVGDLTVIVDPNSTQNLQVPR
jgi:hypothetical protein